MAITPKPPLCMKMSAALNACSTELQQELPLSLDLALTDEEVESLAQVNFRGNRLRDKEGWRFVLQP
jgi:hypothetical protein